MKKIKNAKKARATGTSAKRTANLVASASVSARARADCPKIKSHACLVVGVGASAGGLEAFRQLIDHLPADTGMAFVLVQHLDPDYPSALSEILARSTSLPVKEATDKLPVQPNHVYVIPPKADMTIKGGVLHLKTHQRTSGPHHSIDAFFESLATDQQGRAIGVILSGTATDGTLGLEAIKAEGGITFAQDASAKYDSMPRNAVASGCVDLVLSPDAIALELTRVAKNPYVAHLSSAAPSDQKEPSFPAVSVGKQVGRERKTAAKGDEFRDILLLLRNHSGVDFSVYKPATIRRRIIRRMVLHKAENMGAYAKLLRGNQKELQALYSDFLINVTTFFRNPEAFEALKSDVFPQLVKSHGRMDPLRIWVLGCSTGQEAYSIAMVYQEFADTVHNAPPLQIFATDLNESMLEMARQGLYAKTVVQDVSPERLHRFFNEEAGGFRVVKSLRSVCLFARQNLLSDPPFSRMDLISCRNLLIYIEPALQNKIMPALHYALKPQGFLFLGASESVGPFTELFKPVDKKLRIFSRKPGLTPRSLQTISANPQTASRPRDEARGMNGTPSTAEGNSQREADRITGNRFAPPGVMINADLQVLQFRGATGAYLEPATGKATFDLLKMIKPDLMLPLRSAINKAKKQESPVRVENVRFGSEAEPCRVNLEVIPLKNLKERCYLVFFEERTGNLPEKPEPSQKATSRLKREAQRVTTAQKRVLELEQELAETRDYLQSIQEQYEAANEELQASNEEATSANEELQSLNEELETSQEELESTNEELITVNEEMASRNQELNQLNNDLHNLHSSIQMPILVLDRGLTLRRFTQQAEKVFNLLAADIGRPISGIKHNLDFPDLENFLAEVLLNVSPREREVKDSSGNYYVLRARPYLTTDKKLEGVVLMLLDINSIKEAEQVAAEASEALARRAEQLQEAMGELQYFSYTISHDMRSPLRAMRGYGEMLLEEKLTGPNAQMCVNRINESAERMDKLITDALDYSKLSQMPMEPKPVDLKALLDGMIESYPHWQAPESKIVIADNLPLILANEAGLIQCFSNLIGNALKFMSPHTQPEIKIWAEDEGEKVRVWVEDNGIGIALEHQEKIFDMFQRVDVKYEGTGIGLALVRKAAQRMNALVGVESEPNKGSRFWLEFQKAG